MQIFKAWDIPEKIAIHAPWNTYLGCCQWNPHRGSPGSRRGSIWRPVGLPVKGRPHAFAPGFGITQSMVYVRMTPISLNSSEMIGKWAMISGPETGINFWPHNNNTAIFKTERSFQSVRTASTYDFFVSYHHIEGLKGPTTSAFFAGAVILVSCPFWATLAWSHFCPLQLLSNHFFASFSIKPGWVPFILLLSRGIFTANSAHIVFALLVVFIGNLLR